MSDAIYRRYVTAQLIAGTRFIDTPQNTVGY